jgi:hypothetical protein
MRSFVPPVVALGCSLLLSGCRGSSGTPAKPEGSGRAAVASIVGKWVTSTAPEAASSRTTMAFLESGECQYNSPMILFGKPVTFNIEGKEVAARVIMSGLWELDGDRLRVRITEVNQPSIKVEEPWKYKVISNTDKKLVLEKEDGEIVALFREE